MEEAEAASTMTGEIKEESKEIEMMSGEAGDKKDAGDEKDVGGGEEAEDDSDDYDMDAADWEYYSSVVYASSDDEPPKTDVDKDIEFERWMERRYGTQI